MRLVERHLEEGRARRVIGVLRRNLEQIRVKERNLRTACQFHLFRRPVILKMAAFRALGESKRKREKIRIFRTRRVFGAMVRGV